MKIHLGCGKRFIPGFVHVDLADFPHIEHKRNVDDLSCFKNDSAELIYACQLLEYFDRDEVLKVLTEWKRVLQKNGILRLSVPNFRVLSNLYQAGFSLDYMLGTLYGKWSIGDNKFVYHKTTYDFESLKKILENLGFHNVELWDWRKTEHAEIDDFSQAYFPHMDKEKGMLFNLNIQCKK